MITPEEALGQIYAMRESVANGWVPDVKYDLAFALADIIDDLQAKISRMEEQRVAAWGMTALSGIGIVDCITTEEHDREPGEYDTPLFRLAGAQKIIEDF